MPGFCKVIFLSVAILAQSFQLADSGADSARPHRRRHRAFFLFAMPANGSPYNGKGPVHASAARTETATVMLEERVATAEARAAAAEAEAAAAWSAGTTLAANTMAAVAAMEVAQVASEAAKAATVKAMADGAMWHRLYDELLEAKTRSGR